MTKVSQYRERLSALSEWEPFLRSESGLPGPRANLELLAAVADLGDEAFFLRYADRDIQAAPGNTPDEFLVCCGVVGLGRLLSEGQMNHLAALRALSGDSRWRVREAVAMALQRWGARDIWGLLLTMAVWGDGSSLEQRAVVAALCEPGLLTDAAVVRQVLALLDHITAALIANSDRRSEAHRVLRQALGYGWSVAVVALPEEGKPWMEKWCLTDDHDAAWIMRENLKKNRLVRMDPEWVEAWRNRLRAPGDVA